MYSIFLTFPIGTSYLGDSIQKKLVDGQKGLLNFDGILQQQRDFDHPFFFFSDLRNCLSLHDLVVVL